MSASPLDTLKGLWAASLPSAAAGFGGASDSPLERSGFELVVPPREGVEKRRRPIGMVVNGSVHFVGDQRFESLSLRRSAIPGRLDDVPGKMSPMQVSEMLFFSHCELPHTSRSS
jgi:hypothetical protein